MNTRTRFFAGILLALFAAVIVTAPINAQPDANGICPDGRPAYKVKDGDRLWALEGASWETGWPTFVRANPQIDLEARRTDYSADDKRVRLEIGEPLCGLETSGIGIRNASENRDEAEDNAMPAEQATAAPTTVIVREAYTPWWVWLLLIALIVAFFLLLNRNQRRAREVEERQREIERRLQAQAERHPTTLGPPMVPGGLGGLDTNRVGELMDTRVQRQLDRGGRRIQGPDRVRLHGRWGFGFGDNIEREGDCFGREEDRAYRSVYEMPGGVRFEQFTLIWCGNDARTAQSLGGTWTPDPVTSPAPQPVWGLDAYRQWCDRIAASGMGVTRERLHLHMIDLEERGFRITALDELVAQRQALEAEQRQYLTSAEHARGRAEELRLQAAAQDQTAMGYLQAAQTTQERSTGLQPDIDLLLPEALPPAEDTAQLSLPAANDEAEATVNAPNGSGNVG